MSIYLTSGLEEQHDYADRARSVDAMLSELLEQHSRTTSALWDLRERDHRPVLTLALSDPWGYASADFAAEEVGPTAEMRRRLTDLIGELMASSRRERIELRDAYATATQLDVLRQQLGQILDIDRKGLKVHNKIRFLPEHPDRFLLTDFAVEVDASAADAVREVIRGAGFVVRDDPLLRKPGVLDAVRQLVESHCRDGQPRPRHAICFNVHDPLDLHLLEIADHVASLGDGSLEGVGFAAGPTVPGARSIVLYLTSPEDLRLTLRVHPYHPAIHALRSNECVFILPPDEGKSFHEEFPEFGSPR